jgi:hypothetical protein
MKIRLADESLLPDLLSFLRGEGCVAYYEGGGIEAVRPHSFGEREATECGSSSTSGGTSIPRRRSSWETNQLQVIQACAMYMFTRCRRREPQNEHARGKASTVWGAKTRFRRASEADWPGAARVSGPALYRGADEEAIS